MKAIKKAATIPKITTEINILWSFLGVASGTFEGTALGVEEVEAAGYGGIKSFPLETDAHK